MESQLLPAPTKSSSRGPHTSADPRLFSFARLHYQIRFLRYS
jgi:hypothetical protein